ncbi:hypothetical protein H920_11515 [Fukomys damarensis]|uniref:Uncharacterized protein n=1 Tax=Fukomys damarensis TaxID=885580 RepID=A0A091DA30_FUKDA|nr:hypothetical protein H920_11515 [Fukomys damarensis]
MNAAGTWRLQERMQEVPRAEYGPEGFRRDLKWARESGWASSAVQPAYCSCPPCVNDGAAGVVRRYLGFTEPHTDRTACSTEPQRRQEEEQVLVPDLRFEATSECHSRLCGY